MKFTLSNRSLTIIIVAVLALSAVNTCLLLDRTNILQTQLDQSYAALDEALNQTYAALNQTDDALNQGYASLNQTYYDIQNQFRIEIINLNARLPIEHYDYLIFTEDELVMAKNGRTGLVDFNSTNASYVFNEAVNLGDRIFVKSGEYILNSDVLISNKKNSRLDSEGANLQFNGSKIILSGNDHWSSRYNQISGFRIINGTLRIENSFMTTVTNMIFENCKVGIELANTNTWSEGTKIDTVHFDKCIQSLVFRTNSSGATGSFGNTEVNRCYFNLPDNSVAITVEKNAEFTDSQMQNIRIWIGEFGQYNQTGLQVDGSMYLTLLDGVVFESFASGQLVDALLYAVKIGEFVPETPNLQAGVNIVGNWTGRVYNPYYKWIVGSGGVFKIENESIILGAFNYGEAKIIERWPAQITSFKPQITVHGSFSKNETVTVRVRLEFVDNIFSESDTWVEKQFKNAASIWLDDSDLLKLFPSENIVFAILVDAKVNSEKTDTTVQVSMYGTLT